MKLNIKSWNAVAVWRWDVEEEDLCGICRNAYESCCNGGCKFPGDECPLTWGECSHVFHLHCIEKWLKGASNDSNSGSDNEGTCPLDRRPWVTARAPPSTAEAAAGGRSS